MILSLADDMPHEYSMVKIEFTGHSSAKYSETIELWPLSISSQLRQ
jgi:hypothetical protein